VPPLPLQHGQRCARHAEQKRARLLPLPTTKKSAPHTRQRRGRACFSGRSRGTRPFRRISCPRRVRRGGDCGGRSSGSAMTGRSDGGTVVTHRGHGRSSIHLSGHAILACGPHKTVPQSLAQMDGRTTPTPERKETRDRRCPYCQSAHRIKALGQVEVYGGLIRSLYCCAICDRAFFYVRKPHDFMSKS
jgi:hypothetical protein